MSRKGVPLRARLWLGLRPFACTAQEVASPLPCAALDHTLSIIWAAADPVDDIAALSRAQMEMFAVPRH